MSEVRKKIKRDLYEMFSKNIEQAREIRDLKLTIRSLRKGLKLAQASEAERTGNLKTKYDEYYR